MPTKKKKPANAKKPARRPTAKKRPSAPRAERPIGRAAKRRASPVREVKQKGIGRVTHYYAAIKVAVVKFTKPPKFGSAIHFKGATTDFVQAVNSAQYDHKPLRMIPKGKQVGIKVRSRVRQGDTVLPA